MSRHRFIPLLGVCLAALAPVVSAQTATAAPAASPCAAPVPAELAPLFADWARPAKAVAIVTRPEGDPIVPLNTKVRLKLVPAEQVTLAAKPRSPEMASGVAGLVTFRSGKAGEYRFSTSAYAWIEITPVGGGGEKPGITNSDRRVTCAGIGKNLGFELAADTHYWFQISGTDKEDVDLLITPPE